MDEGTANTPAAVEGQATDSPAPAGQVENAPLNIPDRPVDGLSQGTPQADPGAIDDDMVRGHQVYKNLQAHSTKATQALAEAKKQVEQNAYMQQALTDPLSHLPVEQMAQYFASKGYKLARIDEDSYTPYGDDQEVAKMNDQNRQQMQAMQQQLNSMKQQQYGNLVKNVTSELNEVFGHDKWVEYQEGIMQTLAANPAWGQDRDGIEKLYYANVPKSVWEGDLYKKYQQTNASKKDLIDPVPSTPAPVAQTPDASIGDSLEDHWKYNMRQILGKDSEI